MGNGRCGCITSPHLKSKSQVHFGDTGLIHQVDRGDSNGKPNCHYHNQRTCQSLPEILHSDQGCNFESSLLQQTLDAFGITNHEPKPTTLKGTEWWRDLTAPFYKCCMHMFVMSQNGRNFFYW